MKVTRQARSHVHGNHGSPTRVNVYERCHMLLGRCAHEVYLILQKKAKMEASKEDQKFIGKWCDVPEGNAQQTRIRPVLQVKQILVHSEHTYDDVLKSNPYYSISSSFWPDFAQCYVSQDGRGSTTLSMMWNVKRWRWELWWLIVHGSWDDWWDDWLKMRVGMTDEMTDSRWEMGWLMRWLTRDES